MRSSAHVVCSSSSTTTTVNQFNAIAVRPYDTPARSCVESSMQPEVVENANQYVEDEEQIAGFGEEVEGDGAESASEFDDDDQGDDHHAEKHDEHSRQEGPGEDKADAREEQPPVLGEEEVQPPQIAAQPRLPCRDEVDVHKAMGHAQYRSWCEACVHGQGREDRHLRDSKHRSRPVLNYDYGFMTEKDEEDVRLGRKNPQQVTRLLVGRDSRSKMLFAHMIPHKGISHGSWNFERVNEDIAKLGYRMLILNQDNKPAIVAQVRCE